MTGPLRWLDDELQALDDLYLRRHLRVRHGAQGAHINVDGESFTNFGSNDYLGLAQGNADQLEATLAETGWGSGASPLITGRSEELAALETELAEFEGTEAALVFPSGFAANLGTISALVGKGDIIFSDAKNHASIIDGCRLSGARIQVYPHGDMDYLRMLLDQAGVFRRRLVVTDSLFSMDGDLAALIPLCELAESHDAMVMIDEAHATGVFGDSGRGVAEHLHVEDGVSIRVGTLSKAFGSIGGFVAGSQQLIDFLANTARSFVFSTALPDMASAVTRIALATIRQQLQGAALLARAHDLRGRLSDRGWNTGPSVSQIIPILLGEPQLALDATTALQAEGLLVPAIRPPTVPQGESLLRISITTDHTAEDFDRLINALGKCRAPH